MAVIATTNFQNKKFSLLFKIDWKLEINAKYVYLRGNQKEKEKEGIWWGEVLAGGRER